jgi:glycerate 2-kinase
MSVFVFFLGVKLQSMLRMEALAGAISNSRCTARPKSADGVDGDSPAAGAISDGTTLERAKARGLDASAHLSAFDAFPLFEALCDAIVIGPTGNNLRDLRILLAY